MNNARLCLGVVTYGSGLLVLLVVVTMSALCMLLLSIPSNETTGLLSNSFDWFAFISISSIYHPNNHFIVVVQALTIFIFNLKFITMKMRNIMTHQQAIFTLWVSLPHNPNQDRKRLQFSKFHNSIKAYWFYNKVSSISFDWLLHVHFTLYLSTVLTYITTCLNW